MSKSLTKMILIPYERYKSLSSFTHEKTEQGCKQDKQVFESGVSLPSKLEEGKYPFSPQGLRGEGSSLYKEDKDDKDSFPLSPPPGRPVAVESIIPSETHTLEKTDWASQWISFQKHGGRNKPKAKTKRRD